MGEAAGQGRGVGAIRASPSAGLPFTASAFPCGTVPSHRTEGLEGYRLGKGNILVLLFGNTEEMALGDTEPKGMTPAESGA